MALQRYRIARFLGLNESESENNIDPAESPEAHNMDTGGGRLSVARGYVHHNAAAFPVPADVRRVTVWRSGDTRRFLALAADGIYTLSDGGAAWSALHDFGETEITGTQQDFQRLKIGSSEALLIATGQAQVQKWDGAAAATSDFGSAAGLSNVPVRLLELYYSRLFAAGDPSFPCRLYWSSAPGDGRTVEDWSQDAASANTGGGHVEVGTDSDPITGLFALSNQLLVLKRDSLYRLLGDRPGNFRIYPVNAVMAQPNHTACVRYGDVLYFLTENGLYYFDGQNVNRMPDADKVKSTLGKADLSNCMAAACRDKLYFAIRRGSGAKNDALLCYDLNRRTYMLHDGFTVIDLFADGGTLFLMDGDGYLCRFGEGESYAGRAISAAWRTPLTDLDNRMAEKHLKELYLRGSGGLIEVRARTAGGTEFLDRLMPAENADVLETALSGAGRAFSLTLANVGGSRFTVDGGVEVLIDSQRRVL